VDREVEFSEYVATRGDGLVRSAALLLGRVEGAEDLVQEALVRLLRHWNRVARDGDPDAYLHRIMTNLAVDGWRRSRRVATVAFVPEVAQVSTGSAEQRDLVLRALDQLGRRQRAALVLRYWHDLSVERTAELLGCSAGNVRALTSHGLARLGSFWTRRRCSDVSV
jgi:RNA polymerase sigma-70 factor (sigma-E family)